MNLLICNIMLFLQFFVATKTNASGMPVIDSARVMDTARDTLAAGSAVSDLMLEFSNEALFLKELSEISKIIKETGEVLNSARDLQNDYRYISNYDADRFEALSLRIRSITNVIKRIKRMFKVVAIGLNSKSVNLAVNMLRYERERSQESYNSRLQLIELKHQAKLRKKKVLEKIKSDRRARNELIDLESTKPSWEL